MTDNYVTELYSYACSSGKQSAAISYMGRAKRICYLSPMRAAKVQASLRIRAVSPEPSLLAHASSESRGTFRQKARSLAPLNGWACAVKVCHDGMLEDTNSLDAAHIIVCLTCIWGSSEWYTFTAACKTIFHYFSVIRSKIKWNIYVATLP